MRVRATEKFDLEVVGHVCHIDMPVATSENCELIVFLVALMKCPDRSSSSKTRFVLAHTPGDSVHHDSESTAALEERRQQESGQSGCMHPREQGQLQSIPLPLSCVLQ